MSETPYAETEVLLAIMNQNVDLADALLTEFTKHELLTFDQQVTMLQDFINRAIRAKAIRRSPQANRLAARWVDALAARPSTTGATLAERLAGSEEEPT